MVSAGPNPEKNPALQAEIDEVVADVQVRTLAELPGKFSQLIYLASLRDHNTGRYHHYGLEARYSREAVDEGLRRCHAEAFDTLVSLSLQEQTQDLLSFFESIQEERARLVEAWERLRSYQILPPETCSRLARELFESNTVIILKILRETELWELLRDPHGDADDLT